jgi:hypothetical protein
MCKFPFFITRQEASDSTSEKRRPLLLLISILLASVIVLCMVMSLRPPGGPWPNTRFFDNCRLAELADNITKNNDYIFEGAIAAYPSGQEWKESLEIDSGRGLSQRYGPQKSIKQAFREFSTHPKQIEFFITDTQSELMAMAGRYGAQILNITHDDLGDNRTFEYVQGRCKGYAAVRFEKVNELRFKLTVQIVETQ